MSSRLAAWGAWLTRVSRSAGASLSAGLTEAAIGAAGWAADSVPLLTALRVRALLLIADTNCADADAPLQERAVALTSSRNLEGALVQTRHGVASAFTFAPPRVAPSTLAVPQVAHKPAAVAAPESFHLNDDWVAGQFEQIESCMAAAGALGVSAEVAPSAPAHGALAAPAAAGRDTQAVQTLALCCMEAAAIDTA